MPVQPLTRRAWVLLSTLATSNLLCVGACFEAGATGPAASATQPAGDSLAIAQDSATTHSASGDSISLQRAAASLTRKVESVPPETLSVAPGVSVPVFLGGSEIFRVRASRDGLSPADRAAAIRTRLTAAVLDASVAADSAQLLDAPQGVEVRLGSHFLWVITPDDIGGLSPAELATRISDLPARIREGITKERARRRPIGIILSVATALGMTLVSWLLLRLLMFASRRWRSWLAAVLPRHLRGIRVRQFEVLSQAQVTGVLGGVLARLDVVLGVALLYVYLTLVLSLFPWTQGWSWQLAHFARTQAINAALSIASAVPGLMVVAVIVVLFGWLTRLSDRFFDSIEAGTTQIGAIHAELAQPSKRILKIVLWIAAVIVAFPYIPGAQSKAFQGASLFVGVLFSLGSTGIVGNVIAGIVLTYSRAFRIGDRVRIGDQLGDVTRLGFFATKLRTIRNEELTLPNGQVVSSAIVNFTRLAEDPGLILHTEVTIGYDVDWRTVHGLLIEAARRVTGIEKDPAPFVYQRSLNDFHISYELNCVTHLSHPQLRLYSELHQEIQDAFARAGVEILSPGYHALRDANAPVLPKTPEGPRPPDSGFRVRKS